MDRRRRTAATLVGLMGLGAFCALPRLAQAQPVTPPELVATYANLADVLLGAKAAEHHLVLAVLAATYDQATAAEARARASLQAGRSATADLEALAALVGQLGNEGDAAVAGVRKRLVEQGHHHHSSDEEQGTYDVGFVVVTRAAKKAFVDCATEIGKLAAAPSAAALDAQWKKVQDQYRQLVPAAGR